MIALWGRVVCVWCGAGILLYWVRGLPRLYFPIPFVSGLEISLYGAMFPVLFVPLALTFYALGRFKSANNDEGGNDESETA